MKREELRELASHSSGTMTAVSKADLRELLDALDAAEERGARLNFELLHAETQFATVERENARLREALWQVRAKAGSHTVAVESAERGVDDPRFSGIYSVADLALAAQESADGG